MVILGLALIMSEICIIIIVPTVLVLSAKNSQSAPVPLISNSSQNKSITWSSMNVSNNTYSPLGPTSKQVTRNISSFEGLQTAYSFSPNSVTLLWSKPLFSELNSSNSGTLKMVDSDEVVIYTVYFAEVNESAVNGSSANSSIWAFLNRTNLRQKNILGGLQTVLVDPLLAGTYQFAISARVEGTNENFQAPGVLTCVISTIVPSLIQPVSNFSSACPSRRCSATCR